MYQIKLNVIKIIYSRRDIMKAINLKKITIASAALIGLGAAAITTINQAEPTTVQQLPAKLKFLKVLQ